MSKCSVVLPRQLIGNTFTPYSTNPNYPSRGQYKPLQDFAPGEKYIQINGAHKIVAAAIAECILDMPAERKSFTTRQQRKLDKISSFLSSNLESCSSEIAVYVNTDSNPTDENPPVLLFQSWGTPKQ